MSERECVSIGCVFNEQRKNGLCIGVSAISRIHPKDVIRLCWVTKKPSLQKKCEYEMQASMTPEEAEAVGVDLIQSALAGESVLRAEEEIMLLKRKEVKNNV